MTIPEAFFWVYLFSIAAFATIFLLFWGDDQ